LGLVALLFQIHLDLIQVHSPPEMIQYFHQLLQKVAAGDPEVMLMVKQAVRVAAGVEVMVAREDLQLLAHRKEIQEQAGVEEARIMSQVVVVVPVVVVSVVAVLVAGMVGSEPHYQ
jgi:hypothetical protein